MSSKRRVLLRTVRQARPRSDGTLDRRELGSRLSATPTMTGFRTKMNFSRLPRNASKAADPDNDSAADAGESQECCSPPPRANPEVRRPSLLKFVGHEERYTKRQKRWHQRGE
jgi:hypothetical protein